VVDQCLNQALKLAVGVPFESFFSLAEDLHTPSLAFCAFDVHHFDAASVLELQTVSDF
jgi:hypothetical protein